VGTLLELLDRGPAQAVSRKQGQLTRQEIVSPHSQQKTGGPRDLKGSKG
jgi:hypothetical protein